MRIKTLLMVALSVVLLAATMGYPITTASNEFNLDAEPGCGFVMLGWDYVPGAAHYWIYRGPGVGKEYSTPLTDFPISETTFKDTINIKDGQEYCYYITALDETATEFARSSEACAVPLCAPEPDPDECKLVLRYQQGNLMYMANGVEKGPMDTPPVNINSRLFLVIRYVTTEIPGTDLLWDGAQKMVTIKTRDGREIKLWIGKKDASVDGTTIQIDPNNPEVVPEVRNGRTLLPMRFVAENLGATGPDDIRWYGDTKTVELRFDDPVCEKCDWVGGVVLGAKPMPALTSTEGTSFVQVAFKDCSGKKRLIYVPQGLADKRLGKTVEGYQGNARFCFGDDVVPYEWEIVPSDEDPCDEEPTTPEQNCVCLEITDVVCGDGTETPFIQGRSCRGTTYVAVLPEDMWGECENIEVGNCYEFCGMKIATLADRILFGVASYEPVECPCPCEDCTWVVGEIVNVASYVTGSMRIYAVSVETCEGELGTYSSAIDLPGMGGGVNISDYEGCARVCVDSDGVIVRWTPLPGLDDCCNPPEPETACVCLEIVRGDCNNLNGVDGDGKMWNLRFRDHPELCSDIDIGEFWTLCGEVTRITLQGSGIQGLILDVESATQEDEPCESECNWIRGEVTFNFTKDGSYTKIFFKECGGFSRTFTIERDLWDISRRENLKQYTGCVSICLMPDGETIRMWRIEDTEDCCPDEICVTLVVERMNCEGDVVFGFGRNVENADDVYKLFFEDRSYCDEITPDTCIEVCGFVRAETEDRTEVDVKVLRIVECPEGTVHTAPCFCVRITSVDCDAETPTATASDASGREYSLVFTGDMSGVCDHMEAGTWWDVCGETLIRRVDMVTVVTVETAVPLDAPCRDICVNVHIDAVDCSPEVGEPYARGYDRERKTWIVYFEPDSPLCEGIIEGYCYLICGEMRTSEGFRIAGREEMDAVFVERVECEVTPLPACMCVEVESVDLESDPPRAVAFTGLDMYPMEIGLNLGYLTDDVLAAIVPDSFFDVCGNVSIYRTGGMEVEVTSVTPRDEPCGISIPATLCITVTSLSGGRIHGTDINGMSWDVSHYFEGTVAPLDIDIGSCYQFIGYRFRPGDSIIVGNPFYFLTYTQVDCPCPEPEEECFEGRIEIISCDSIGGRSAVVVRISAGNRRVLLFDDSIIDCDTLSVGDCVSACGTKSIPGTSFTVARIISVISCE
ncbi:MAG TPA: copper amine oxidase N-terminal domain-containing protein [Caldisericia bacterium]|nr:copper amine oxidase N-terminal domain-containing protein [Caldisericia bacterium]HPF49733.1 copper amine oxidase N-terminal domain-containing protein [Caldisericia bacterium]HPI84295.1 copper amine oxidase N-terminal domain-containing protein [Caldisericia bacterium]HPQ93722.1 copper amine oxidase N-terminal domain-containing protein [Caldisericia bacterium]HRV74854.1 copper amine oxidase N-terminal domain-containing protein [Caldisericia bacterium]